MAGLITREYVNTFIKERPEDTHKGQCGRVLIVAGSYGMAGAAVLAARGALKSGAGLVKIAAPDELFHILQTAVPQATCMSISQGFDRRSLQDYGAIAIGPGIGGDERNYLLIETILNNYDGPVIIDADGINCICKYGKRTQVIKDSDCPVVMTPHPGEGNRLLESLGTSNIATLGRQEAAEYISHKTGATVLLKGSGTVVTCEDKGTYINTTGNPGMATGGSGDVLTDVIAAIAASGIDSFEAAKLGAYIHGFAGDIAAEDIGQWGMTAVDIESALPVAFKQIVGK